MPAASIQEEAVSAPFPYALQEAGSSSFVVLPSPIPVNRRFALARVLGDRLYQVDPEPFIPVLKSRTYRQKFQRAFAAEFLCPFGQVQQRLDEELSMENQDDIAAEFAVSPMVVSTELVNHGLLPRDSLEMF